MRHRGLKEVSGAEVFVEEREIFETQVWFFDLNVSVQVAVALLRGGNPRDQVVYLPFELWIGMISQHVRGPFDPLVDIRIRPPGAAEGPSCFLCRDVEVANAAC